MFRLLLTFSLWLSHKNNSFMLICTKRLLEELIPNYFEHLTTRDQILDSK